MTLLLTLLASPLIVFVGAWTLFFLFTALSFWRHPWCGHRACCESCRYRERV